MAWSKNKDRMLSRKAQRGRKVHDSKKEGTYADDSITVTKKKLPVLINRALAEQRRKAR